MEEYVSKQEAAKFMLKWFAGFTDVDHILDGIIAFGHIPSIEVVRCKDCKYNSNPPEYGNAVCDTFYGMTDQMGYCCYGEPRGEELGSGEQ